MPTAQETRTPSRRGWLWPLAGLTAAALVVYHNSLGGPFVFDDVPSILQNPSLKGAGAWWTVLWPDVQGGATVSGRPVVNLTLALNHALGGEAVGGYHLFNLLIHLAAGILLYGVARRTLLLPALAGRFGSVAGSLALALAGLWLVHPLQTESVTYVIQRTEALAGLFYLLTLYGFIRRVTGGSRRWFWVSVGACWLGMATKEVVVTVPVMVWLYDRTFLSGSFKAALTKHRRVYVGMALSWVLLAGLVAGTAGRGGTAGLGAGLSVWSYALTQCDALVRYLCRVIWPSPLVFDYGTAVAGGLREVCVQAVIMLGLLGVTSWALVKRPVLGFLGAWFFLLLAPSSSVVPVASQTMAEHRVYLALAAPLAGIVVGLFLRLGRHAWVICSLLAVAGGGLTLARNADYASAVTLWADTAAKRPDNPRAHHNLGLAEFERGDFEAAVRHVQRAIALDPETAEPYFTLGLILTRQGKIPAAIASYERVISLNPRHASAENNLANVLFTAGRMEEAGVHYASAVRLEPAFAGARNSYGNWLLAQGRAAEALAQCEEAIRLQPGLADARLNAANACLSLGRPEAAQAHLEAALRQQPDFPAAHNNLGNILLGHDDAAGAMGHYAEAVRQQPDYFEPRRSLALMLLHLGRPAEARPHLVVLQQLRPDDAEIAQALARARP